MKYFIHFSVVIFLILSSSCKQQPISVSKVTTAQKKIDSTLAENKAIDSFIAPYRGHLNKTLDSVLCIAVKDHTKKGGLESTLGNLIADISLLQTSSVFKKKYSKDIDFVLLNHGGLRAPILEGPVTARTAFEVMPFENELVVAELSFEKVKELMVYLAQKQRAHPISNLQLTLDKTTKEAKNIKVDKKTLDQGRSYFVLTTDYLQQGGDSMNFFKDPIALYKTDYKLRNAMIDYFKSVDTLNTALDKRMYYAE